MRKCFPQPHYLDGEVWLELSEVRLGALVHHVVVFLFGSVVIPGAGIGLYVVITAVVFRTVAAAETLPEKEAHGDLDQDVWTAHLWIVSRMSLLVWDSWGWSYSALGQSEMYISTGWGGTVGSRPIRY